MDGSITTIAFGPGRFVDLYVIRFNKQGKLLSPNTFRQFLSSAANYTDVFIFSHGWNNIFAEALQHYTDFINTYIELRRQLNIPLPDPYVPALLGIIWPSTSYVLPWESGPAIAAGATANGDAAGHEQEEMLEFVLDSFNDEQAALFSDYLDRGDDLGPGDATKMASVVLDTLVPEASDDIGERPPLDQLLNCWSALDQLGGAPMEYGDPDDYGTVPTAEGSQTEPAAAGSPTFNPRSLLRYATVWKMKTRAGVVGTNGVGPVLRKLMAESKAKMHMIGHSFGARVILSAIASEPTPRTVDSVLLLQPAINRWCFADTVTPLSTKNQPGPRGGYNAALERIEKPIFTTFSNEDVPLHSVFHLVLHSNLAEVNIAGVFDIGTYRYGALGGWGPLGLHNGQSTVSGLEPGIPYTPPKGCRVLAIDGSSHGDAPAKINGHGDVITPVTAWMLHCLTQDLAVSSSRNP